MGLQLKERQKESQEGAGHEDLYFVSLLHGFIVGDHVRGIALHRTGEWNPVGQREAPLALRLPAGKPVLIL